jgi:nucleoside diphosphate kinase
MNRRDFTLVILKPDAFDRDLNSAIEEHLKAEGLTVCRRAWFRFDLEKLKTFYNWEVVYESDRVHEYLCERASLALLVSGSDALTICIRCKTLMRSAYCANSDDRLHNLMHCSDSPDAFLREFQIVFPEDDVSGL